MDSAKGKVLYSRGFWEVACSLIQVLISRHFSQINVGVLVDNRDFKETTTGGDAEENVQ